MLTQGLLYVPNGAGALRLEEPPWPAVTLQGSSLIKRQNTPLSGDLGPTVRCCSRESEDSACTDNKLQGWALHNHRCCSVNIYMLWRSELPEQAWIVLEIHKDVPILRR